MTEIPSYKIDAAFLAAVNVRRAGYGLKPVTIISDDDKPAQAMRREVVAALEAAETAVDNTVEEFSLVFQSSIRGKSVRVLGVGPFLSLMDAVEFASGSYGQFKLAIKGDARGINTNTSELDSPDGNDHVVGSAYVEVSTKRDGVTASYKLY